MAYGTPSSEMNTAILGMKLTWITLPQSEDAIRSSNVLRRKKSVRAASKENSCTVIMNFKTKPVSPSLFSTYDVQCSFITAAEPGSFVLKLL